MRTLSVQNMGNGFEVETPSFLYWVKAGIGFTIGAGLVAVVVWTVRAAIGGFLLYAWLSRPIH